MKKNPNKRQKKLAKILIEVVLEAGQHARTVSALEALARAESYLSARDYGSCGQVCAQLINSGKLYVEPYVLMLRVAIDMGRVREMLDIAEKLMDPAIKNAHDVLVITHALQLCNRHDKALELLDEAIKDNPANFRLREQRAIVYADTGRIAEAIKQFRVVIKMSPNRFQTYHKLSALDPLTDSEMYILKNAKCNDDDLELVQFALARAYQYRGDKTSEIECLRAANDARHRRIEHDHAEEAERTGRLIATSTREYMNGFTVPTPVGAKPIFVIGMPRADLTLIELILTSHPDVDSAGHSTLFECTLLDTVRKKHPGTSWPDILLKLTNSDLGYLSDEYRAGLTEVFGNKSVFVDATPGYYRYIGLLALAMPDAKFIHAIRHPLATCLDCYRQSSDDIDFGGKIEDIARRYLDYRRVMAHWGELLGDRIHAVQYDNLVSDPELESRNMLSFCGLSWSDNVLTFYDLERVVHEANWTRARKPPDTSEVDTWRDYAELLRPAQQILESVPGI